MSQPESSPPPSEMPLNPGGAWLRLCQQGATAWTDAWVSGAATLARINAAQVDALLGLAALGGPGWSGATWLHGPDELLREEMLFAEMQAEKFADGARTTLGRLAPGSAPVAPIPLPE